MMEFNVRRTSGYNEMEIKLNNDVLMGTGLLDEKESVNLARELIYAAERLLPAHKAQLESDLMCIREDLE